jgi:hypothetical protein
LIITRRGEAPRGSELGRGRIGRGGWEEVNRMCVWILLFRSPLWLRVYAEAGERW